jgi:polyisoprenoid-binding protein YceI
MKKIIVVLTLFVLSLPSIAQTFTNDKAHSKIVFSVSHLTISNIEGIFKSFDVKMNMGKEDLSDLKFSVSIDASSINTAVEARDTHLKSADFFDVTKYPKIEFTSTKVEKQMGNKYRVSGNLNMHGVTKEVVLDMTYNGSAKNPTNNDVLTYGFSLTGSLSRSDFKIGEKFPTAVVGDEVTLYANLEFPKK